MNKISTILLLGFLSLTTTIKGQNAGDNVFAGYQVHTIQFQFNQPNYWDSLVYYYNQGLEKYMVAAVTVNGVLIDSVGVRLKGNSSYSHPNNKKPIRVSFDEYREDQKWDGLKGIHLSNCWGDPTFIREKLHLDFCRDAGIKAPRANYASVYINGQLWGLYSLVEHVDKRFLSSRYGETDGNLYKAVDAFGGSNPVVSDFRWYGSAHSNYTNRYELKTEESTTAWYDLVRTIDTLNNSSNISSSLGTQINLSNYYKAVAADILFANLDSYIGGGRNFYIYYPPSTNKLEWIVWDASLTIGGYSGGVSNYENLSLTYVSNTTNRPLFAKIVNTTTLKNEYLKTLCRLFNNYFSAARLFPKIDSLANMIRPYVYADPKKMYTNQQFETNLTTDVNASGGGSTRKPGLKSFITARVTSVQNQLNAAGITCQLTVQPGNVVINEFMALNTTIPDPVGEFDDWIELYNNTTETINLGGLFLSDDALQPTKWQFPDNTTIPPNGYLIIWADNDTGQAGLHASFALSGEGEHLRLSNIDGSLLDSLTFGPQTTNLSMQRIPNGSGNFVQGIPTFNSFNTSSTSPTMSVEILPKYIQGISGTNNNRIPYVFRARLNNLMPNTTYRYINQVVISTDGTTTSGSGNCIFVNVDGTFVRTTSPAFNSAGNYGEFVTDSIGSYTGWFITEPTGNSRFVAGEYIFMRIRINDGAGGTSPALYFTTSDSIKVLDFGNTNNSTSATAIFGNTDFTPKDFIFLYDNIEGNTRPISGTVIENDGINYNGITNIALFYRDSIDNRNGAWGTLIPNILPNGIRRIEIRNFFDGNIHPVVAISENGLWQSGANTVNPNSGLTPIKIDPSDFFVPVELTSFSAMVQNGKICLTWTTANETNNLGFEIEKLVISNNHIQQWKTIGYIKGAVSSTESKIYNFWDEEISFGKIIYRLKQIDLNGEFTYSNEIELEINPPNEFVLYQNYPNPFNPITKIKFSIPNNVVETYHTSTSSVTSMSLQIYDVLGNEIATLANDLREPGYYEVLWDASGLPSGIYFYRLSAGSFTETKKLLLLK